MQGIRTRYFSLIALFAVAIAFLALQDPASETTPRWPGDDALYAVPGWNVDQPSVEFANGTAYITRKYQRVDTDEVATLTISTSTAAKRIYRAGPEVPYLGNGYSVEDAPPSLLHPPSDKRALVASRGDETWLAIHTYGERRGRFGHAALAWGLSLFDTLTRQPNDYYIARVVIPLTRAANHAAGLSTADHAAASEASALADTLFARIAAWYAQV
jgi:hypothetical protein